MPDPYPPALNTLRNWLLWLVVLAAMVCWDRVVHASEVRSGTASYYNVSSAIREGTCTNPTKRECHMANGRALDDEAYTAASWDYPFGTTLRICRSVDGRQRQLGCVDVRVTDRGPAKRLYRRGRLVDLSQQAFADLAPLKTGIIEVTVEQIR